MNKEEEYKKRDVTPNYILQSVYLTCSLDHDIHANHTVERIMCPSPRSRRFTDGIARSVLPVQ